MSIRDHYQYNDLMCGIIISIMHAYFCSDQHAVESGSSNRHAAHFVFNYWSFSLKLYEKNPLRLHSVMEAWPNFLWCWLFSCRAGAVALFLGLNKHSESFVEAIHVLLYWLEYRKRYNSDITRRTQCIAFLCTPNFANGIDLWSDIIHRQGSSFCNGKHIPNLIIHQLFALYDFPKLFQSLFAHFELNLWPLTLNILSWATFVLSLITLHSTVWLLSTCSSLSYFCICSLWPWPPTFKITWVHPVMMVCKCGKTVIQMSL